MIHLRQKARTVRVVVNRDGMESGDGEADVAVGQGVILTQLVWVRFHSNDQDSVLFYRPQVVTGY